MKLKNKKTGEIGEIILKHLSEYNQLEVITDNKLYVVKTLTELNEDWEDYEGSKQWYGLNPLRDVGFEPLEYEGFEDLYKHAKELGIAFETKEEAKKAVEKLKAWKRLKDKGFRFTGFAHKDRGRLDELEIYCQLGECPKDIEDMDDVHLLFGGEE